MKKDGKVTKAIDFDVLKNLLIAGNTEIAEGRKERYEFNWPEKKKHARLANQPTTSTLRPVRGDSVDFDTTENLYIEGDNLEVLKLLQNGYAGRIKMIYIDPPYNTGNDFVYNDDFKASEQNFKEANSYYDEDGNVIEKAFNPDDIKAYVVERENIIENIKNGETNNNDEEKSERKGFASKEKTEKKRERKNRW